MSDCFVKLRELVAELGLDASSQPLLRTNACCLASAWMTLAPDELPRFAKALAGIGGRLATTTVYRPDAAGAPGTHEIAYHFVLGGMPVTARLTLRQGESVASIARLFPNADWEEREMMELGGVAISEHPNPRRMFLDESIEAGVFDRYVPYSEFTDAANHDNVWTRIREQSRRTQPKAQEAVATTTAPHERSAR